MGQKVSFLAILGHFAPPPLPPGVQEHKFSQDHGYQNHLYIDFVHVSGEFQKILKCGKKFMGQKVSFLTILGYFDHF